MYEKLVFPRSVGQMRLTPPKIGLDFHDNLKLLEFWVSALHTVFKWYTFWVGN